MPGQRRRDARQHEQHDARAPDGDTHEAGRLDVVADDVRVGPEPVPIEQHPGQQGDAHQPDELHRDPEGLGH